MNPLNFSRGCRKALGVSGSWILMAAKHMVSNDSSPQCGAQKRPRLEESSAEVERSKVIDLVPRKWIGEGSNKDVCAVGTAQRFKVMQWNVLADSE